jgi:uncharacterized protein (TIGR00725 family)
MSAVRDWIAVLGGASRYTAEQLRAAYTCGAEIGRRGKHLITGATNGIPYAASLGAKDKGALVIGISPALNAEEHVERYGRPLSAMDFVVYSGLGVDGRAPLILRSAAAAIFIGGEMGTLAEFAAAWICGCPDIGILESSGGITAQLRTIAASTQTTWGSSLVHDDDAATLARKVCAAVDARPGKARKESDRARRVAGIVADLRP